MSTFLPATVPADFDGKGRRVFVGRCFAFWGDGTRALGTMMFGRPLERDIAEMIPFFEVGVHKRFKGHASFVDGRGLEAVDVLAFKKLLAYLTARRTAWGPNIGRQAILHPGGVIGVLVSGALHVARPPHPFATFGPEEVEQAYAYNGVPELQDDLEALWGRVSGLPDIVRGVQQALVADLRASSGELAKSLGLSSRTLQRRLGAAGTSLRKERQRLLSQQIEELLSGTQLDLEAIAARVGLNSAAHLVRHFRATHGMTPGAWRERKQATFRS